MTELQLLDGWQLDDAGARGYERHLVPALLDGWAADLVTTTGVEAGARVLDVACGTGIVARNAARRVGADGRVTGVDRNPSMLTVAREVTDGSQPPITWELADAADLPFVDRSFDAVCCQQGLQFFPAPRTALAEMFRVLAPGGRLGVSTCRELAHQPGYAALVTVLERHIGPVAADVIASPYALGDLDALGELVADVGFHSVRRRIEITALRVPSAAALLELETSSSPVGNIADRLDGPDYDQVVSDLAAVLAPHTDDDGVVFPFETAVITASR